MRSSSLLVLILATGCSESLTIEGNLLEVPAAAEVRYADASSLLEAGEFRIEDISGESIRLVFSGGEGGEGVMAIDGVPSGGRIRLHDVWIEDGVAFPTRIDAPADDVLIINGLRVGGAARVDGDQEIPGTILAISREDGTLLLRPHDATLPDVGVFLGTGTVLQSMDGEPVDFGRLGFGDTLIVRGVGTSGYVLSNSILSVRGGVEPDGDESSTPVFDPVPPGDQNESDRDNDDRGRDGDEDRGRDDDAGPNNRGRGRPGFTPGRRSQAGPWIGPAPGPHAYLSAWASPRFS